MMIWRHDVVWWPIYTDDPFTLSFFPWWKEYLCRVISHCVEYFALEIEGGFCFSLLQPTLWSCHAILGTSISLHLCFCPLFKWQNLVFMRETPTNLKGPLAKPQETLVQNRPLGFYLCLNTELCKPRGKEVWRLPCYPLESDWPHNDISSNVTMLTLIGILGVFWDPRRMHQSFS